MEIRVVHLMQEERPITILVVRATVVPDPGVTSVVIVVVLLMGLRMMLEMIIVVGLNSNKGLSLTKLRNVFGAKLWQKHQVINKNMKMMVMMCYVALRKMTFIQAQMFRLSVVKIFFGMSVMRAPKTKLFGWVRLFLSAQKQKTTNFSGKKN